MKQGRLVRALAIFLVAGALFTVAATAASDGETLISKSYLYDSFLPKLRSFFPKAEKKEADHGSYALEEGMEYVRLAAGESLSLGEGQVVMALEGRAKVSVKGSIINASMGLEAGNGYLNRCQRYILCEDSAATVSAETASLLAVSAGLDLPPEQEQTPTPAPLPSHKDHPFTDLSADAWYYSDVLAAYERGLINGMSASTYVPDGSLTVAQCIKLAACMHQLWHEGSIRLSNSPSGFWYESYVDYALSNGIIPEPWQDYDAAISRRDFVRVFYNALPGSCYPQINDLPGGAIPDVADNDPAAYEIYVFYRSGILTGYADASFAPDNNIDRAEVATIMNRMMDQEARKHFTLG